MTTPDSDNQPMFYRKCGYDLTGLPSPRCPECGLQFDWNDPGSYASGLDAGRGVLQRAAGALVLSALVPGIFTFGALVSPLTLIGECLGVACAFGIAPVLGFIMSITVIRDCRERRRISAMSDSRRRSLKLASAIVYAIVAVDAFAIVCVASYLCLEALR